MSPPPTRRVGAPPRGNPASATDLLDKMFLCQEKKEWKSNLKGKVWFYFYPIMMKRKSALGEQIPSTEIWIAIPTITSSITREYTADQKAANFN